MKDDWKLAAIKIGGLLLSIGGLILTNKASDIQQSIAIKAAVKDECKNKLDTPD